MESGETFAGMAMGNINLLLDTRIIVAKQTQLAFKSYL